jgi:glycerol uptake facilitator-like aquaporin
MSSPGSLRRRVTVETLGTALLALAIVGSGASADAGSTSVALTLAINAVVTAVVLGILIAVFFPHSGAHFNPAVTAVMFLRRSISGRESLLYVTGQLVGAATGAIFAHWLFTAQAPVISNRERISPETFAAEVFATAGLVFLITTAVNRFQPHHLPVWVAGWIGAGYFITPSTGFANPAITAGRMFTDTFTGIDPLSAVWFICAQFLGALIGFALAGRQPQLQPPRV